MWILRHDPNSSRLDDIQNEVVVPFVNIEVNVLLKRDVLTLASISV